MSRFPDPARSRAVLIGVSHFPDSPDLASLPATRRNVADLWRRLTHPLVGVLAPECCEVVDPAASTAGIGRALHKAASEATDMLLVYYAGHGLVDDRGRLYLATGATNADSPKYSALSVDLLREDLGGSSAAARVLILDCCFSGRAIEVMAGSEGLIDGQLSIAGTYTMTSTTANAPSYVLAGDRHSAFTAALLDALDSEQPLSLDEIYRSVAAALTSRGLPRPRQRATDTAAALALMRGRAGVGETAADETGEVRFRSDRSATLKRNSRVRQRLLWLYGLGMALAAAVTTVHAPRDLWAVLLAGVCLGALFLPVFALLGAGNARAELVIDHAGLTTHMQRRPDREAMTRRTPWSDISHVGVLPPRPNSVNSQWRTLYAANHLLVIRLRTGAAYPATRDARFPEELVALGYRVVAPLGVFQVNRDDLLAALERFAGGRTLRSTDEFLASDPRLTANMLAREAHLGDLL